MSQYNLHLPYLSTSHYCMSQLQEMNWHNYFPRTVSPKMLVGKPGQKLERIKLLLLLFLLF